MFDLLKPFRQTPLSALQSVQETLDARVVNPRKLYQRTKRLLDVLARETAAIDRRTDSVKPVLSPGRFASFAPSARVIAQQLATSFGRAYEALEILSWAKHNSADDVYKGQICVDMAQTCMAYDAPSPACLPTVTIAYRDAGKDLRDEIEPLLWRALEHQDPHTALGLITETMRSIRRKDSSAAILKNSTDKIVDQALRLDDVPTSVSYLRSALYDLPSDRQLETAQRIFDRFSSLPSADAQLEGLSVLSAVGKTEAVLKYTSLARAIVDKKWELLGQCSSPKTNLLLALSLRTLDPPRAAEAVEKAFSFAAEAASPDERFEAYQAIVESLCNAMAPRQPGAERAILAAMDTVNLMDPSKKPMASAWIVSTLALHFYFADPTAESFKKLLPRAERLMWERFEELRPVDEIAALRDVSKRFAHCPRIARPAIGRVRQNARILKEADYGVAVDALIWAYQRDCDKLTGGPALREIVEKIQAWKPRDENDKCAHQEACLWVDSVSEKEEVVVAPPAPPSADTALSPFATLCRKIAPGG